MVGIVPRASPTVRVAAPALLVGSGSGYRDRVLRFRSSYFPLQAGFRLQRANDGQR